MFNFIENNFIWVIVAFSTVALIDPLLFTWLKPLLPFLLGLIMFGVGVNLNSHELQRTWNNKWLIVIVIFIKYTVMPIIAYITGKLLQLPLPELIGIVIVGACPGGTAANVMAYFARANIALTVTLTFGTTLIAPLVTPALVYAFLHQHITIPFWEIFNNMTLIIFLPVVAGLITKNLFLKKKTSLTAIFPSISIIAIALVIACVMALAQKHILSFPIFTITAILILNLAGYLTGWSTAKLLGFKKMEQKSIVFEYGMFDTGLGVVIAASFFGPLAALPAALLSILQNLTATTIVKIIASNDQLLNQSAKIT